ncbi:MAG TPA: hypothetical protein VFZ23_08710 [Pyrinomonadaceae bacterium]
MRYDDGKKNMHRAADDTRTWTKEPNVGFTTTGNGIDHDSEN